MKLLIPDVRKKLFTTVSWLEEKDLNSKVLIASLLTFYTFILLFMSAIILSTWKYVFCLHAYQDFIPLLSDEFSFAHRNVRERRRLLLGISMITWG